MSQTLAACRKRIRALTGDDDPSALAVSTPRLNAMIEAEMLVIAGLVHQGQTWNATYVSISSGGGFDYTLSSTRIDAVADVIRGDGVPLDRLPIEALNAERQGTTAPTGVPERYALFEGTSQSVTLRLDRTPVTADTLQVLRSDIPSPLTSDASTIPYSDILLPALWFGTAATAIAAMTEAQRAERNVSADTIGRFERQAAQAIQRENARYARLHRQSHILQRTP